ncbi:MAG: FAD-dependent oxidoreductase [Pseudomonadota bacterium]
MKRRAFLGTSAAALATLAACDPPRRQITGGFTGINAERGHALRDHTAWPAPTTTHQTQVLIAGGGIAGLAAARALRLQGVDDFALLELEDSTGGNSRGGTVAGIACPLGAHYLPVPTDDAPEVQNLLEELGLRRRVAGRWTYDERHLCHSPQERLFFNAGAGWQWQEGLLPVQGVGTDTLAQYQRFAQRVKAAQKAAKFTIPASDRPLAGVHRALNAITFEAWLNQNGLDDNHLRWYLGYCCRDDYGAGIATVSAWAGIHYFASRHGFHAPGEADAEAGDGLLTWPEGNGWLAQQLAAPLGERAKTGRTVLRIAAEKHGVVVDAFNHTSQATERWQARQCIVALPLFIASRVLENPPPALRQAAAAVRYAPWLVANLHIDAALNDRPGAAPSWDNVIYGSRSLGYVDAMHQSLQSVPGATVLTCYRALGDVPDGRRMLLERSWSAWRDEIVAELAAAHPDLPRKATRMDITRYGHAMAVPTPGLRGHPALNALQQTPAAPWQNLRFAHSDLAGYSVFEEAFTLGHRAGESLAKKR